MAKGTKSGGTHSGQQKPGKDTATSSGARSPKGADPPLPGSPWGQFPSKDDYPKVPDPVDQNRMVSTKQANRPFLAYVVFPHCILEHESDRSGVRYTEYRAKREQEHKAWLQRKQEREEKISRGEEVGPEEPDPTVEPEVGFLGLFKFILYLSIAVILAGKFFTGSFLWELELPNISKFLPAVRASITSRMVFHFR